MESSGKFDPSAIQSMPIKVTDKKQHPACECVNQIEAGFDHLDKTIILLAAHFRIREGKSIKDPHLSSLFASDGV